MNVEMDYPQAISVIAGLESRMDLLVRGKRMPTADSELFDQMLRSAALVYAKVRVAAQLDDDEEWAAKKAVYDAEQRVDYLLANTR